MKLSDINGEVNDIIRVHEQSGFNYKFPSFQGNPLFPIQRTVSMNGKFIAASLVKVEAEVYLFMNHTVGTPEDRWEALKNLHDDVVTKARLIGFDSLMCAVPPEIEKSFAPRLRELGWEEDRGWRKFVLELR
jgi:hypothetical protein